MPTKMNDYKVVKCPKIKSNYSLGDKKFMKYTNIKPRRKNGYLYFKDHPEFKPNLTPKQMFHAGIFGGTYYRNIYSCVTKKQYVGKDVIKEFPKNWFPKDLKTYVISQNYDIKINKYGRKSGTSLRYWEKQRWIEPIDSFGYVQWYMRFYLGRRCYDDARQIDRFNKIAGEQSGRWRKNLENKIKQGKDSPTIRQLLLQWGFELK